MIAERRPTRAFGPFTFDGHNRMLRGTDGDVSLPPRVLAVLELLLSRAGEIVSRQELIDSVWKEAFVTDTSLAEAVSVLRQALGDDPQSPTYIQTIHRRGYRFVAPVAEIAAQPGGPGLLAPPGRDPQAVSPSIGGQIVPWSAAVLLGILAIAAVWQLTHRQAPAPQVVRMRIETAAGTTLDSRAPALALSPDGSQAAWSGCDVPTPTGQSASGTPATGCRLYVRGVDRLEPSPLPGTEDASAPFFSPDGRWVGFFAEGKLKKVALAGGAPMALTDASQPLGGTWLENGRILFAASAFGGLLGVSDRGGDATALTMPVAGAGEIRHAWPSVVPGGRAIVFTVATSPLDGAPGRIAVARIDSGERISWHTLLDSADLARGVTADYVAFSRGGELHAVAIDRTRLSIAGAEQVVVAGLAPAQFAVSETGALIYAAAGTGGGPPSLAWSPPSGVPSAGAAALRTPALSPDGKRIAGVSGDVSASDVWVADVERGTTVRLTHVGINGAPVWGEDGSVLFSSTRNGPFELWTRHESASEPARPLWSAATRGRHIFPTSISRNGTLAYVESGGPTRSDIWIVTGGVPQPVVQTPFDEMHGMLAPDGRLIAYQSDESGRWEVYLMRWADTHRIAVSTNGGTHPYWSADGRALYYRAGDDLARVDLDHAGEPVGPPSIVRSLAGWTLVGVGPDGRVLLRADSISRPRYAVLTLEWIRELRQALGPPAATLPR